MSEREGLFGPAFCALSVRNMRVVFVEETTVGGAASAMSSVFPGRGRMSLGVALSEGDTKFGSISCRVNIPGGVRVRPLVGGASASTGFGDPGGE